MARRSSTIELKQLRYFVRIVDLGSVSRAAGALHMSQSALSQQLAALEADMKTTLLHRTTRGVQLTEPGRLLYQHAQLMLQQEADARTAVQAATAEPSGHVALGLPSSLVRALGLPIFEAVRRAYPLIRLQIVEELSATILERVKTGRLSLGIAFDDGNLEGLDTIALMEERLFLVASPKAAFARRKVIPVRELAGLELVLPSATQGVRPRVERTLLQARLGPARIAAEIDSHVVLKQAAAIGMGPTVLSWTSVEPQVSRGELVALEIVRPSITRTAHVCVQGATPPTRATECVRAVLMQAVRTAVQRPSWRGARSLGPA